MVRNALREAVGVGDVSMVARVILSSSSLLSSSSFSNPTVTSSKEEVALRESLLQRMQQAFSSLQSLVSGPAGGSSLPLFLSSSDAVLQVAAASAVSGGISSSSFQLEDRSTSFVLDVVSSFAVGIRGEASGTAAEAEAEAVGK